MCLQGLNFLLRLFFARGGRADHALILAIHVWWIGRARFGGRSFLLAVDQSANFPGREASIVIFGNRGLRARCDGATIARPSLPSCPRRSGRIKVVQRGRRRSMRGVRGLGSSRIWVRHPLRSVHRIIPVQDTCRYRMDQNYFHHLHRHGSAQVGNSAGLLGSLALRTAIELDRFRQPWPPCTPWSRASADRPETSSNLDMSLK